MNSGDVCAVIYAEVTDSGPAAEVIRAVKAQSREPKAVLVPAAAGRPAGVDSYAARAGESRLAAGVRAAQARASRWIWLLDGKAVPEPGALGALLAAADVASAPRPMLLASKVVDGDGHLHPAATPRHEIFEKAHSVDAAERHLVQLRCAAHGSVLVAGPVAHRFGSPRSDLPAATDMREWSARILRSWDDTGYLVPGSVAVLRAGPSTTLTWREWRARARVLGSDAWRPNEKLWEVFLLGGALPQLIHSGGSVKDKPASERPASVRHAGHER